MARKNGTRVALEASSFSANLNANRDYTSSEIEDKINQTEGKRKEIYQRLYQHYQDIIKIREELKDTN